MSDPQRKRILSAVVAAYYAAVQPQKVVFDTNRGWCGVLPAIAQLFPNSRLICCVRSPAWILDSVERLVHRNAFQVSRLFGPRKFHNVYARTEYLMNKAGFIGCPLAFLREAWYSEDASRLIVIRYESLISQPTTIMSRLYEVIGEDSFEHDFENVEYEEPEFDARVNMPGLHTVARRVESSTRLPILPPDLFKQHNRPFWDMPGQNPRGVMIL